VKDTSTTDWTESESLPTALDAKKEKKIKRASEKKRDETKKKK